MYDRDINQLPLVVLLEIIPISEQAMMNENRTIRIVVGFILAIISGVFFYIAFPPLNFWPFIFLAPTPYLIAQHRLFPLKWSALAPTIAIGLWLWPFLYRIFNIPDVPIYLQHMGLLVAVITFFMSTERKFHEITGYKWFILQGLAAWVGFEMIRSFIPVLGTMGFSANPLAGQAWLIQPVSIFSIYGLSLLVTLVSFSLAKLIMAWMDQKWELNNVIQVNPKAARNWMLGTVLALAAWVGISLLIYHQETLDIPSIRIAALQMDLKDPGHQVDEDEMVRRLDLLIDQVHEAADKGAQVVYVPEMAFGFDPQKKYSSELQQLVAETDTYLYFTYAYDDAAGWHNETVLITPEGDFSPIYGKQHAFGEPPTVTAGSDVVTDTPVGKLGSIICMDGVFTDSARNVAREGAQLLAIPSYNTTVGISEQNWTHFTMRAVENQVPVINADRGFYTMITDQKGRILADIRTPEGTNAVVIADVQPASRSAFYTGIGDWLGWVSLAGFVFFMVFQSIVESRAKKAAK